MAEHEWSFSYEGPLHEVFPAVHEAQSAYLGPLKAKVEQERRVKIPPPLSIAVIAGGTILVMAGIRTRTA